MTEILHYSEPYLLSFIGKIIGGFISGITATITAIIIFRTMYYQKSFRDRLKQSILSYLELANGKKPGSVYCDRIQGWDENRNPIPIPVYPSTKAIMDYCLCSEYVYKRIRLGAKFDEAYFNNLLGELRMEGRVSPKQDEKTDEVIGWEFTSYTI